MRCTSLPSWVVSVVLWVCGGSLGGCLDDVPEPPDPPAARIVAAWDPLACTDEHQRVVVELEDEDGRALTSSAACRVGWLALDAPRWGIYRGRFYSWVLGEPPRAITHVTLTVDAPIVHWQLSP